MGGKSFADWLVGLGILAHPVCDKMTEREGKKQQRWGTTIRVGDWEIEVMDYTGRWPYYRAHGPVISRDFIDTDGLLKFLRTLCTCNH